VFEAVSPTGQRVALKTVMWEDQGSTRSRWEAIERFQREARAARSLSHPNIVQVLDIGADGDTFFIVMEFLDGHSVRDLLNLAGAIKLDRAVEIVLAACEALACAHEHEIVHRDIKPDNIVVLRTGLVKLTDFGLASIVHEKSVTQTGTMMGTFAYMSPEQVRGEKLDAGSDIFSLGATFYEMVSGQSAFGGAEPAVVVNRILNEEPTPISGLPAQLSRVITRCLRKQLQYRYQTAREMIAELGQWKAAAQSTRTAILTPGAEGPAVVYTRSSPAVPGARPQPTPESAAQPTASGRIPDLRCPKCHEAMSRTTPSCWRCGTPNPVLVSERQHGEHGRLVQDALETLSSRRKKQGWFRKTK